VLIEQSNIYGAMEVPKNPTYTIQVIIAADSNNDVIIIAYSPASLEDD